MFNSEVLVGLLVLAAGATPVAARALYPRACTFTGPAAAGDTCKTMAAGWGVSEADFISWNPGADCNALVPGQEYCVEWDLGSPPPVTTTAQTITSPPVPTTTAPVKPSPTQEGLISDCTRFHKIVSGDTCAKIRTAYGNVFTLDEFYSWNPSVGTDCGNLWLDYYVCVGLPSTVTTTSAPTTTTSKPVTTTAPSGPSPTQGGIAADCQRYHKVASGDTCQKIVDTYKTFTLSNFYSWNPDVGNDCSSLWLDYYVCIGVTGTPTSAPTSSKPPATTTTSAPPAPTTPSPTQPDITAKCNKYHLVSSGDYCQKIADQYKVTLANFYSWNPSVGNTCADLWLGYYVCVGSS